MKINLTVTNDLDGQDQTYEVIADGRDVRKYEESFEISWLATDMSYIQMTQLAWVASRRHGLFEGDYAAFDKVNTGVKSKNLEAGEVDTANPTQQGAPENPL